MVVAILLHGCWRSGCCWLHDQCAALTGALFLGSALGSGTAALDAASFRALEMVRGDPGFVVAFGAGGNGGTCGVDFDWLGFLDGLLTSWLLLLELGEVRDDPDVVEGVADTDGAGEEKDVEEDPGLCKQMQNMRPQQKTYI